MRSSMGKTRALIVAAVLMISATMLVGPTQASSLRNGGAAGAQVTGVLPGQVSWTYYDTTGLYGRGDNILNLINPNGSANPSFQEGGPDVCAMIYVFDDAQEMGECCGCPISPAGMETFSVEHDLTADWVIGGATEGHSNHDGSIAIVATGANVPYVAN